MKRLPILVLISAVAISVVQGQQKPNPAIDVEKATNGVDADSPFVAGVPQVPIGGPVTFSYVVTNTGNVQLQNLALVDTVLGDIIANCPPEIEPLDVAEVVVCTVDTVAEDLSNPPPGVLTVPGNCPDNVPNDEIYENTATVSGESAAGDNVSDFDPSHYCNAQVPAIDIEKSTNGVDADDPNAGDAPQVSPGDLVTWTYKVTNTGTVDLVNVAVVDDQGVAVACPQDTLAVSEMMTCSASALAEDLLSTAFTTVPGLCGGIPSRPLYENMGTATGETVAGDPVQDVDPSHYCNPAVPDIDIEKATNGVDADDASFGDAPMIAEGDLVNWTYVVTNTGNVDLVNVGVVDDQGVVVSCPQDTLGVGESMVCTASAPAEDLNNTTFTTVIGLCEAVDNRPLYENMGTANGETVLGETVQDVDPSHYCNPPEPAIDIEKATNGVDADDPNAGDAPQIAPGDPVSWSYVVTNIGNVALGNVVVVDDQGVAVSCPQNTLAVAEVMLCTANGLAQDLDSTVFTTVPGLCGGIPGRPLYENMGTASGNILGGNGDVVEDTDPSHYCNPAGPAIDIEKSTNGVDADDANAGDAPQIAPGDLVSWEYKVTNTGNVDLVNVVVTDDQGVVVSCPQNSLTVAEMMTCTASALAEDLTATVFTTVPGLCGAVPNQPLYENMGTASGETLAGDPVQDVDPSHYCNPPGTPAIVINKRTNGIGADGANNPNIPQIAPGDPVNWEYEVRNTGEVQLINVMVVDDHGTPADPSDDLCTPNAGCANPSIVCPTTVLEPPPGPGNVMVCTASDVALDLNNPPAGLTPVPGLCAGIPERPLYENMGMTTGESVLTGELVEDDDPSHYCNPVVPDIDIEKATNGVDADDASFGDAPMIAEGDLVNWTYVVTNTGNVDLVNVGVVDDQGVVVSCPQDTLGVGESMVCTASAPAEDLNNTTFTTVIGLCEAVDNRPLYENMGTANGETVLGETVQDVDPSHYCNPPEPAIDIEKATNGVDADDPNAGDAPQIAPGDPVSWSYVVTNIGNVALGNVVVVDDQGVAVSCPQNTLAVAEVMLCTANGLAQDLDSTVFTTVPGLCGGIPGRPLYENMGTASGNILGGNGDVVEDTDPSHYCNPAGPAIDIEKSTNGVDADDANAGDAPQIAPGDLVSWEYKVTNTGNVDLVDVGVTDDQGVVVSCPQDTLAVGEMMTCAASALAEDLTATVFTTVPGLCGAVPNQPLYENMGTANGETLAGDPVQDVDPSHYCNPPGTPAIVINKRTNGVGADSPNAVNIPQIAPGDPVNWEYEVRNTGEVKLVDVVVTDDRGTPGDGSDDLCTSNGACAVANQVIVCPQTMLDVAEVMVCTASESALDLGNPPAGFTPVPGLCAGIPNRPLYENMGVATGASEVTGEVVQDDDPSHYCNPPQPSIDIEKATNAVDADDANAAGVPQVAIGELVSWTYKVTNTGDVDLVNVAVVDDQGVVVSCPQDTLAVGEMMTCTASAPAEDLTATVFTTVPGLCAGVSNQPVYENMGTASGETVAGDPVQDVDPSHYCNPRDVELAVCVETDAATTLTPMQTKVFNVRNFFNIDPVSCPTGFILGYAKTGGDKQPIEFNHLTGSTYIRGNGSGNLRASSEQAFTIQGDPRGDVDEGKALSGDATGGAFPVIPFDGVSYSRISSLQMTDFRAPNQGGTKGTVLTVLDVDINRTIQNPSRLVAVDAANQAEVGFSGSLEFACHVRVPVEQIPGIGGSLLENNFGSSFGKLELELFNPPDDGGILAVVEEYEPNRSTLRKLIRRPLDGDFLGEQPGSVVVYPLFNVGDGYKTTIRLVNNHPSEEVDVHFFRVCGGQVAP